MLILTSERGHPFPISGDSAGTQTQDLRNRNPTLYSTKLRSQWLRKGTLFYSHIKIIILFFKLFFCIYVFFLKSCYLCKKYIKNRIVININPLIMKKKIYRLIVFLVMLASAQGMMAQPSSVKISSGNGTPNIKDFVVSFVKASDGDDFLNSFGTAVKKGTHIFMDTETVCDPKNGYASYQQLSGYDGTVTKYEMCYWNCANKKEKIVAINLLTLDGESLDESYLLFYRYNNATHVMKLIDAPFNKEIRPIDWTKKGRTSPERIEYARTVGNEDANAWAPVYTLPRVGKNIEVRIADGEQLQLSERQNYVYEWNGNGFNLKKTD